MTSRVISEWIGHFDYHGEALFLSNETGTWTYNDLATSMRCCKKALEKIKPGVCLIEGDYSVNSIGWLISGLAFGWKVVPVVSKNQNTIASRKNISSATHRVSANSDWVLETINYKHSTAAGMDVGESGVILFSSGTTGEPKAMCKVIDLTLADGVHKKAKSLAMGLLLLFDHIGGLNTLLSGLRKSTHLIAPLDRSPRVLARLIEAHSVRVLPCSPTFLNMMYLDGVFDEFDFKSLRLVTYGTERMPDELLKRLSAIHPRIKFMQTFGTSETGIVQTKSLSSSSTFFTIDDPSVDWKVVDKELWLRSSLQISGYLNTTEVAIDEGWFKTGDLVDLRDDGYFKVVGRKKEVINVGGEKVLPGEIEDIIMSINEVIDCTAFAVPNGITGQAVGVRIVPAKGTDLKELKRIIRHVSRTKMDGFKVPAKIIFEADLKHTERFKKER
ncbi:MAG: acyl-coenzyme A synthetase/AMP-(fatty) acid ligase [Nonlabens sp.]|jgi:acyl-coenzyme A synthetase/AMP-(fatty) acid ligase